MNMFSEEDEAQKEIRSKWRYAYQQLCHYDLKEDIILLTVGFRV